ncbi:MAG: hypothetical protein WAO71_09985 [Gallionella sp.]
MPPAGAALAPVGTQIEAVQPTSYAPNGQVAGSFSPVVAPTLQGNLTTLPANLLLAPMSDAAGRSIAAYARNEPVFIRVISMTRTSILPPPTRSPSPSPPLPVATAKCCN